MFATSALLFWVCVTFGLGKEDQLIITPSIEKEVWVTEDHIQEEQVLVTTTGRPRHCQDILREGSIYEGYYIVYPEDSAPNKVSLIYCSKDAGMKKLPSKVGNNEPARNCLDILQNGMQSGPYIIYPYLEHPADPVMVLCDQETDGGGWTVIQKRFGGTEEFYRPWIEYIEGFGNIGEEHYLGNDKISALTDQVVYELRVDLEAWDRETAYAKYDAFYLDARYNYQLLVFGYNGTAGDSFSYGNGQSFSTFDADNDNSPSNVAEEWHGAWWYKTGARCNLNGHYYPSDAAHHANGMTWFAFRGWESLKSSKMMVRPYSGPYSSKDSLDGGQ